MMLPLVLQEYAQPQWIKEVPFPPGIRFQQILVIGPPGVGKSTLIRRIGGWLEEGHLDLAEGLWWRSRALVFTPRELHLYLPFKGLTGSLSVYDPQWLAAPAPLDFPRLRIPPARETFLAMDWRHKYVLEFLLPPAEQVFAWRLERARQGTHPVDEQLTLEQITRQLLVFWNVAKHLHRCDLPVYIRRQVDGPPLEILDTMDYPPPPAI